MRCCGASSLSRLSLVPPRNNLLSRPSTPSRKEPPVTIASATGWTRALAVATVAVAGLALSGCSLINQFTEGGNATRDDSGEVVESNDSTDVFTLRVGDCLNDSTATETVETVPTVPCPEPHDSEIYASIIIEGDTFPGAEDVLAEADAACLDAFSGFAGVEYADSKYFYSYYFPTESSWEGGDREILCTIYDEAGPVTGSLQNIGR